ncbi:hypothetical protein ACER0C_003602 [Sarotherodon galilaeus]
MPECITELQVSLDTNEEDLFHQQGFTKNDVNLNQGARGNTIYLWHKKGSCPGITTIQFSFSNEMAQGLIKAGYEKIPKNLNEGAGGDKIYLWYSKSENNVPIVDIDVTKDANDEAQKFKGNWERLACDLNRNDGGKPTYLWVKREKQTYIRDIKTTDAFRDLKISITKSDYENYEQEGYQPVKQDLNKGTGGNEVFLWYKKDICSKNPIKAVTVITNSGAVGPYQRAGVNVIQESLNTGNGALACEYVATEDSSSPPPNYLKELKNIADRSGHRFEDVLKTVMRQIGQHLHDAGADDDGKSEHESDEEN